MKAWKKCQNHPFSLSTGIICLARTEPRLPLQPGELQQQVKQQPLLPQEEAAVEHEEEEGQEGRGEEQEGTEEEAQAREAEAQAREEEEHHTGFGEKDNKRSINLRRSTLPRMHQMKTLMKTK